MTALDELPTYDELPTSDDGVRLAWGVFGEDDEVGTLNMIDTDRVSAATRLVERGLVHALNWEIDMPQPHPWRRTPRRIQRAGSPLTRDDHIDHLHLQFSTQWDGLRHVGLPSGFYNGIQSTAIDDPESDRLGIDRWARRGIVGRGVLLDVGTWASSRDEDLDPNSHRPISIADLENTISSQGTRLEPGDILLVRTGWVDWYESATPSARSALARDLASPGLESSEEMARWFWDHRIAAAATDTVGFEAMPFSPDFPTRSLHARLIAGLGMPIGELFSLGDLAVSCRSQERWTFLFASAPLNVRGGVGSPANALAIC